MSDISIFEERCKAEFVSNLIFAVFIIAFKNTEFNIISIILSIFSTIITMLSIYDAVKNKDVFSVLAIIVGIIGVSICIAG